MKEKFMQLVKDEEGATAVEYAVMLVLIIIVCLAAIAVLGGKVRNTFQNIANTLAN